MPRPRIIPHGKNEQTAEISCQEVLAKKSNFGTFHKAGRKTSKTGFPQEFSTGLWKTPHIREFMHTKKPISPLKAAKSGILRLLFVENPIGIVDNFMQPTAVEKSIYRCKAENQPRLRASKGIVQISEFAF